MLSMFLVGVIESSFVCDEKGEGVRGDLFFCDSAVVTPESDVVRSRPINYLLLLSTVLQKVDEPVKS